MSSITQQQHLTQIRTEVAAVLDRAHAIAGRLTGRELVWSPPGGGWSVGQVFEHLLIADGSYLVKMRPIVAGARAGSTRSPGLSWHPSLAGRVLVWALRSSRKLPAPPMYQPPPAPRERVAERYLEQLKEVLSLVDAARAVDLRASRVGSPVSPLIRLNLGDCFAILAVHSQRHMGQAERVAARALEAAA